MNEKSATLVRWGVIFLLMAIILWEVDTQFWAAVAWVAAVEIQAVALVLEWQHRGGRDG